jgi:alternate signal-mediated exported protein
MKKSEAKKRKKKVMLIATLSTAAIIVGGLTFAWYTSRDSVTNTFKTSGSLKTVVVENFTPPTNWQPGVTTDKVVQVTNTGTIDAYTRVKLDEVLTYYEKTGELALDGSSTVADYVGDKMTYPYIRVDAEAIEKTVKDWNDAVAEANKTTTTATSDLTQSGGTTGTTSEGTDNDDTASSTESTAESTDNNNKYVKLTADELKTLGLENYSSNLVIYRKASTAYSKNSSGEVVENGINYEYLGYYDTGYVESNVSDEETGKKKICYELNITVPNLTDTQSSDGSYNQLTNIDHVASTKISCSLSKANLVTISTNSETDDPNKNKNISDFIELEFNTEGASGESDWYYDNGYYYYRGILASGQSTSPLLKAVRFKEDVGNGMTNLTYNLTVVSDSTQATKEAFNAQWSNDLTEENTEKDITATTFETIITNLAKGGGIVASNIIGENCAYSTSNKTACSANADLAELISSSRTHDGEDTNVTGARSTVPSGVETTTKATNS